MRPFPPAGRERTNLHYHSTKAVQSSANVINQVSSAPESLRALAHSAGEATDTLNHLCRCRANLQKLSKKAE